MSEPFVLHVVFHLPEDGLRLYGTFGSVFEPFLRGEPVPCLLLVLHELVVGPDGSCGFLALVASPPQGTSLAVLCPVDGCKCPESALGLRVDGTRVLHVLPHRTDIVVSILVIVEVLQTEDVILERSLLLLVEIVVFHVCLHVVGLHERVVLFTSIACIGTAFPGQAVVTVGIGGEERDHRKRVRGIGEEHVVGDELVLGAYLQVVGGLGLSVVHRILLQAHEGGIGIGLGVGVALAHRFQVLVILSQLLRLLLQLLCLLLPLLMLLFLFLGDRLRLRSKGGVELGGHRVKQLGRKLHLILLRCIVLGYHLVYLLKQHAYLLLQSGTVLLHRLAPDEGVPVGLGLYLSTVDILYIETYKTALGKKQHHLREHGIDLLLHAVAETVDGCKVGLLIAGQPDEVDVTLETLLYLAARIDVVHVAVDYCLEHHAGMERTAAIFLI